MTLSRRLVTCCQRRLVPPVRLHGRHHRASASVADVTADVHPGGHDPSDTSYRQILSWITVAAG